MYYRARCTCKMNVYLEKSGKNKEQNDIANYNGLRELQSCILAYKTVCELSRNSFETVNRGQSDNDDLKLKEEDGQIKGGAEEVREQSEEKTSRGNQ